MPRGARRQNCAAAWLERGLWAVGAVAVGYCAFQGWRAAYDQEQGNRTLDLLVSAASPRPGRSVPFPEVAPEGSLVGRLEIPRLGLRAIVFEGTSDGTLARGVGRMSGSGAPGQPGNLVLAGHRDTFFRPLRNVREGDLIQIKTPNGMFAYEVESTAVVSPAATGVLRASGDSTVTLITCYPFRYIGSAPERFIVRARKIEGTGEKVRDAI